MNTMPEAPSSALPGNSTHCSMPETSAVNAMPSSSVRLAVAFLKRRAHDKQQQHVAHEMLPPGVAQHMAEQPHKKERVRHR